MALNLLFWCVAIGIGAALAVPFIVLFRIGIRKRSRLMKWLGGIPAAIILIGAFVAFCLLIYGFTHPWSETNNAQDIRASFKSNFDFAPSSDVVPLHQKIYCRGDFGCMYLEFQASSLTLDKLTSLGFQAISASDFLSATGEANAPKWWVSSNSSNGEYYDNLRWKGSFSTNRAYLFFDRALGLVCFYSEGID
jgi:hypothetical protein